MENQMQDFEKLLRERLEKLPFAVDQVKNAFLDHYEKMLAVSSLLDFKCDLKTYSDLLEPIEKWNAFSVSHAINRFNELSPLQLDISVKRYQNLLTEIQEMAKYWNDIVGPIQKKLQVDFKNRMMLEQKNQSQKPKMGIIK